MSVEANKSLVRHWFGEIVNGRTERATLLAALEETFAPEFVDHDGVGGMSYMKAKGVWHPSPVSGGDLLQTAEPLREELVQQITDVKQAGTAMVDGVATRVYTYTQHADGLDSSATLWIDTARGLPVKIDSVSQTENGTAHGTETITYDPAITIDAPIR